MTEVVGNAVQELLDDLATDASLSPTVRVVLEEVIDFCHGGMRDKLLLIVVPVIYRLRLRVDAALHGNAAKRTEAITFFASSAYVGIMEDVVRATCIDAMPLAKRSFIEETIMPRVQPFNAAINTKAALYLNGTNGSFEKTLHSLEKIIRASEAS